MTPAPVRLLDRAVAVVAMAAVVILCLTVLAGVFSRGIGEPVIWSDEASRFVMVWLACLGWILAGRKRSHIRVRFFLDKVPEPARGVLETLMQAAVCLFGVLTAWYGAELVRRNLEIEATTVPIAMAWMYLPVVFAGIATALQGGSELWQQVRRRNGEGRAA
ncbi:TRAP transporter small permease [uncultured Alsobacter sp.]|uniref:TRAP transporter small permease n=1 Tax=uncultured Alsobacter sp. TaxID=1748258 RepID=UPI0025D5A591|nr:TRAP transporter small permease [uncultured Alsobacter sp.]